jgi:hypothetical protein
MMEIPAGDYLILDGLKVWWQEKEPERIHLTTDRPDISDEDGQKAGLRIVFSSNPASADYNPGNFNRMARWLRQHGKSAPDEVPLGSRLLRDR